MAGTAHIRPNENKIEKFQGDIEHSFPGSHAYITRSNTGGIAAQTIYRGHCSAYFVTPLRSTDRVRVVRGNSSHSHSSEPSFRSFKLLHPLQPNTHLDPISLF